MSKPIDLSTLPAGTPVPKGPVIHNGVTYQNPRYHCLITGEFLITEGPLNVALEEGEKEKL